MKQTFLSLLLTFIFVTAINAQVATSNPVFFNVDTENLEIIFDASLGNQGLMGYTGEIYAHTGVITSASTGTSDWRHVIAGWEDNTDRARLTRMEGETDKWILRISPNIREFYGIPQNTEVLRLAFVFRNHNGTRTGRDDGGTDIFLDIPRDGLTVLFQNPIRDRFYRLNEELEIRFVASQYAALSLHIDGEEKHRIEDTDELEYTHIFSRAGNFEITAKAETATETASETIRVFVPMETIEAPRPAGLIDGINYINDTTVGLVKFAPRTPSFPMENIFVIGDFNDWTFSSEYQMFRDEDYWWLIIEHLDPNNLYRFQYAVNNDEIRVTDAYTRLILDPWHDGWINEHLEVFPNLPPYPTGKTTGLVATFQINKPQFEWQTEHFNRITNSENLVIYEMLIRDFTEEGTFRAAMEKLDYLELLGITAIKIMPVQEFDGNDSWGYNPNHFFALDKAYGTVEDFKRLIDAAHKRGIAVIIDKVFNHTTGLHPFSRLYWDRVRNGIHPENPWLNVEAPHPWSVFYDFNHEFHKTREHFRRVLQFWIEEFRIDGYRMDLTKGFTQKVSQEPETSRYDPTRVAILKDYFEAVREVDPDFMFILEHFTEDREERILAEAGMYLWRNINHQFGEAIMGRRNNSSFTRLNASPRRWVGYAESHDEERNFYRAKMWGAGNLQTDSVARLARVPLQTAFVVLVPGPKMIWQFGEFGYDIHINHNGRTGRKPIPWGWLQGEERQRAFVGSAKAINLRRQFPRAFTEGDFSFNIAQNHWNEGRSIRLSHSDLEMIVLGNFDAVEEIEVAPRFSRTGVWHELMSGAELFVEDVDMRMTMNPGELWIFTDRRITLPEELHRFDNPHEFRPVPFINSAVTDWINIETKSIIERVVIYDVRGNMIMEDRSGSR